MLTVLITGGTGLVGRELSAALLEKGYEVIILTRDASRSPALPGLKYAEWDIMADRVDPGAIANADFIIHLAGAGVAEKRWTRKRKREIRNSRVNSGKLLVNSLAILPNKVKALISASGIGWYGPDRVPGSSPFTEDDPPSADFLGTTCREWEGSVQPARDLGKRVVTIRTGIVLSKKGGALAEFLKPLRVGVAAILGKGDQVISWIHINDLVHIFIAALENEKMNGAYNAVAPNPVSNKELVKTIARVKNGRFYIPFRVPSIFLKLILGEMSMEVLKSTTVSSEKLSKTGYTFLFPQLEPALKDIIKGDATTRIK